MRLRRVEVNRLDSVGPCQKLPLKTRNASGYVDRKLQVIRTVMSRSIG
jgi:hypothetical protein